MLLNLGCMWANAQRPPDRGFGGMTIIELPTERELLLALTKLSKEDKKLVSPDESDKTEYRSFLKLPDTSIIKLLNASCTQIGIVELPLACASGIPGFGSYYSFRTARHLYPGLSDIRLEGNKFVVQGFLAQGIIVPLEKTEIENVTLTTEGMRYLAGFVPAETASEAEKQALGFQKGLQTGNHTYYREANVVLNAVYGMRTIAYRSKAKTVSLDSRRDITIAFKVIRKDENGNVILVWRKLRDEAAPRLRSE